MAHVLSFALWILVAYALSTDASPNLKGNKDSKSTFIASLQETAVANSASLADPLPASKILQDSRSLREATYTSPSSPLSVNLLCVGMACDVIKCHVDSDCPPDHECTGSSTNRLTTAGGLLGAPLGSMDVPFNPLRTSGGIFSMLPHLMEGTLDGVWGTVAPELVRPLGELGNSKYCVLQHWDTNHDLQLPMGSRQSVYSPSLSNGFYRTQEEVTPASMNGRGPVNPIPASGKASYEYQSPQGFIVRFGSSKNVEAASKDQDTVEATQENLQTHPQTVLQQSGKYVTLEVSQDERGNPYIKQQPIRGNDMQSVPTWDTHTIPNALEQSPRIAEVHSNAYRPAHMATSDSAGAHLALYTGNEEEKLPLQAENADEISIQGQSSFLLNVFNTISDTVIKCLNPTFSAIVGSSFTFNLTDSSPDPNFYSTDLFNIYFTNEKATITPPFVYVKEATTQQNLASTVDVLCSEEGRYPVAFEIFVFYGFELAGAVQVCMAEGICDLPSNVAAAESTRDITPAAAPSLHGRGAQVSNARNAKQFRIHFNSPSKSVNNWEFKQPEAQNSPESNLDNYAEATHTETNSAQHPSNDAAYVEGEIKNYEFNVTEDATVQPDLLTCANLKIFAKLGEEVQVSSANLFHIVDKTLNETFRNGSNYYIPSHLFENTSTYLNADGHFCGTYACQEPETRTESLTLSMLTATGTTITQTCNFTLECRQ